MLPVILDIILIGIVAAICINSYVQGLLVSLFNLISSLAAVVISFLLYPVFSKLLAASSVYDSIKEPVSRSLEKISTDIGVSTAEGFVEHMKLPGVISDRIVDQAGGSAQTQQIIESISDTLTGFILQAVCIVIIFIIVKVLLMFVKNVIKGVTSLPVIRQVDKAGGVILGLLEGFVILTVAGALFTLFSGRFDGEIITAVENSVVGRFFYYDNVLIAFLSGQI